MCLGAGAASVGGEEARKAKENVELPEGDEAAGDPSEDKGFLKAKALSKSGSANDGLMGRGDLHHFSRRWKEPLGAWLRMPRLSPLQQQRVVG